MKPKLKTTKFEKNKKIANGIEFNYETEFINETKLEFNKILKYKKPNVQAKWN